MAFNKKDAKDCAVGIGFLLPNILGFMAFTVIPLVMSIYMAFTDWNLEMHNYFRFEPIRFVGFDNFIKLFTDPDFGQYFGNTFFLMIGIPFGVAGSLVAALLLNWDFNGSGKRRIWTTMLITAVMIASAGILVCLGMGATAMTLLMVSLIGGVLVIGSLGGKTVYRTLFYFPYFTAGVATYILWKKLYNPLTGPINNALRPILEALNPVAILIAPACTAIGIILLVFVGLFFLSMVRRKLRLWRDGECGTLSAWLGIALLSLPLIFSWSWCSPSWKSMVEYNAACAVETARPEVLVNVSTTNPNPVWLLVMAIAFLATGWGFAAYRLSRGRKYNCIPDRAIGDSAIVDGSTMVGLMAMVGIACVCWVLPQMVLQTNGQPTPDGLTPPQWLADYYWAKPSLLLMGFWGAIGSNNMLLYLAGLSGVPQELYEAADIDGASPWQRFWNITWPQLSNVTFFIMIMAVIGGLQGGFDMARVMTQGGPAGSTTTLAYYIYTQGFGTGRLGYASAVSWLLFLLVFVVTMFNWKFGNRYTNE